MRELVPDDGNELNMCRNSIKVIKKRLHMPDNENIETEMNNNSPTPTLAFEENRDETIVKEIPKEKRKKERSLKS